MDESVTKTKMDEHLMRVEQETIAALDSFQKSGLKVDKEFISDFLKVSINRLTQTCICYEVDVRSNTSRGTPSPVTTKTNAHFIDLTDSPEVPKNSKRKSKEFVIVEEDLEQPKKLKTINANAATAYSTDYNVNQSHMKCTIFYCIQCLDPNDTDKSYSGTIDDVYKHWMVSHESGSYSEPFKFYAFALCNCYHCNEVGTYQDLVKHHKDQHKDEQFAIVDRLNFNKCGICYFEDGDLIKHFRNFHSKTSNFFNPVHYEKNRIEELLTINVYKEPRCIFCIETFANQTELTEHYTASHLGFKAETISGCRNMPSYLICGFCEKIVERNLYLNHFKVHVYDFKCEQCAFQSMDLVQLILHEKNVHRINSLSYHCATFSTWLKEQNLTTNMVFENGLILQNCNVLDTEYDYSKPVMTYIDEYVDLARKRVDRTEMNGTSGERRTTEMDGLPTDSSSIAELHEQRKLANNIYIGGIQHQSKDIDLHDIFLNLCQKLDITANRDDIKEIYMCKSIGLIVKLRFNDLKKSIIREINNKCIYSNELVDLDMGQEPRKINIRHQMTKFYTDICIAATKYQKQRDLYSFDICYDGVLIKRNEMDNGVVIQSKQQLVDLMNSNSTEYQ
ncbi:uncharacterized protein LOC116341339 [Contarinia nasturtii]|uniref:uncharacterized protein LOC116341339 n=1 Tax=Contarinia nasturtii TaxID=265458 RepID=UPI0012D3AA4E|nr:uncharacterized protein LOC116341339 [Contarinia nasturtii]